MTLPQKWSVTAAAILLAVVAASYLRQVEIGGEKRTFLPQCSFHSLSGLHCPGCGNTRATQALLRGDLAGAARQNIALVIALPFLAFGAWRAWSRWMFPHRFRPLPLNWRWSYSLILVGLVVLFAILRNIPHPPFNWLAPVPITSTLSAGL